MELFTDDGEDLIPPTDVPDGDPEETREWLESLDAVVDTAGASTTGCSRYCDPRRTRWSAARRNSASISRSSRSFMAGSPMLQIR